jgi:LysR family hca operon transcriptional activator
LSVISRPLAGEAPSIDLVLGYHKANNSPLLKTFLSRVDDMISHVIEGERLRPREDG